MRLILTFNECQSELKCTHCVFVCVCLLNECQGSEPCVYLYFMHMILLNMFLICRLVWHQGDMGPMGEMGLPGPNGLKVISLSQPHTHTHTHTDGNSYLHCLILYCLTAF